MYHLSQGNAQSVQRMMDRLNLYGSFDVNGTLREKIQKYFWGGYCTEKGTLETISDIYREYGYLIDTHTAVSVDVYDKYVISTRDMTPAVIVSTASPFKFNAHVVRAVFPDMDPTGFDEYALIRLLSSRTGLPVPEGLKDLQRKPILHQRTCARDEMTDVAVQVLTTG
ncbi:MAG TPA: hypothetical protein DD727_05515 [Clostridiales bacterium]|nr:hypothetical protein [Clostridiales bacterium]